ncbi:hypothetical protein CDD82_6710 [Ophiocordyceps australis]|uniref:Phosphoribosyltransferase domain-containing protein n=1 Tax=Ophiocordyceps australis TaxID=1399860 RepID=A0A2C5YQX3_9HYPO|nr:hypothetical protein CDD82_6710 [Ophiocordyceps australis]
MQHLSCASSMDSHGSQKPRVIGLYGLPRSGKSTLLHHLEAHLDSSDFCFYQGHQKVVSLVPGGEKAFNQLSEPDKQTWRARAITDIGREAAKTGRTAIVTNHLMFWCEEMPDCASVHTAQDLATLTHIVYLEVDEDCLKHRRASAGLPEASPKHLRRWQETEAAHLRSLCRQHGILFAVVSDDKTEVTGLMTYLGRDGQATNMAYAEARLDRILLDKKPETALVIAGDGTLSPNDTAAMFWNSVPGELLDGTRCSESVLRNLFGGSLGYSDAAFAQATLLCEEALNEADFERICKSVASRVTLHADFVSLLEALGSGCQRHVVAIVMTCGLGRVWQHVLAQAGLADHVRVVGGGRVGDGFVVNPGVKAGLVARLKQRGVRVVAFGDSPLDMPMLQAADEAVVVVGDECSRSWTMEAVLRQALTCRDLRGARQALMPSHVAPRLDLVQLPRVDIAGDAFIQAMLASKPGPKNAAPGASGLKMVHATDGAATKLLMTPALDGTLSGEGLRRAHRRIGGYLALQLLPDVLGLDSFYMPHADGHQIHGFRVCNDSRTAIVAMMPTGEPMAMGVAKVVSRAAFIHARCPQDLEELDVRGMHTVVLVSAFIVSGGPVASFVERLRLLRKGMRLVVVAGLVEREAVSGAAWRDECAVVALMVTDGKVEEDTGNRLFNTRRLA